MKKSVLIILSFILFSFGALSFSSAQLESKGSNWERSCEGNTCETTLYSYEKYFFQNDAWEEIDENFYDCSDGQETRYCTKNYYFNVTADGQGLVSANIPNGNYSLRLSNISSSNSILAFSPIIDGNTITYEEVIEGVDLRYQYLPHKLKEEIIIKERPLALVSSSLDISFARTGDPSSLSLERSYICDANMICEYLTSNINENSISVEISASFLNNPNIQYPLTIDPTIILNESHIAWNGHVQLSSSNYTRYNNPSTIALSNGASIKYRGDIDWNVSSIADVSTIRNITVSLYTSVPSFPYNLSIMQMEKSSSGYANVTGDCPNGNCLFYNDMSNGTEYNRTRINVKNVYQNYTLSSQAVTDFQNKLSSDIFSLGLMTDYTGTVSIGSKDYVTTYHRPRLIVTHSYESYNLTYDANGNMIQGFNKYLEYDGFHRLARIRQVNSTGAIISDYLYDHEGNRLRKRTYRNGNQSDNESTYYFNSRPADFIQVRNASGIFNFTYYYLNDKLASMKDNNEKKLFYHSDHLGSTTLVTNESGDVVEDNLYLPYGALYTGSGTSRFLYTGKEFDADTELYYYGARYYDPDFMHFVQPDKVKNIYDPQNLNPYSYVLNNPYKYVDENGNYVWVPAAIGGIVGATDFSYQYFIAGQDFGKALAHGGTTAIATTAALYAPLLTASAAIATGGAFAIGAASSIIHQSIDNPNMDLQSTLPEAAISGGLNIFVPRTIKASNIRGVVNYGRDKLLSAGAFSETTQKQFVSDLITEGTTNIINEGASSLYSGGSINIRKLINNQIYNNQVPQVPVHKQGTGSGGRSSASGGGGNSGGGSGCGVTMSCSNGCGAIMSCG